MAARMFSRRKDSGYLESIREAKIMHSRETGIMLTVVATSQIPPAWLASLSLDLVHDDGVVRTSCDVTRVAQRNLQYTLTLRQRTEGDFAAMFGVQPGTKYLDVGRVVFNSPWDSNRTFANETSRAALRAVVL